MIAFVEEDDAIVIDVDTRTLEVRILPEVLAARKAAWKQPEPRYKRGVMAKYANTVSSACFGAVTS
jgi:dihydroxy-acid dehydratase